VTQYTVGAALSSRCRRLALKRVLCGLSFWPSPKNTPAGLHRPYDTGPSFPGDVDVSLSHALPFPFFSPCLSGLCSQSPGRQVRGRKRYPPTDPRQRLAFHSPFRCPSSLLPYPRRRVVEKIFTSPASFLSTPVLTLQILPLLLEEIPSWQTPRTATATSEGSALFSFFEFCKLLSLPFKSPQPSSTPPSIAPSCQGSTLARWSSPGC